VGIKVRPRSNRFNSAMVSCFVLRFTVKSDVKLSLILAVLPSLTKT